MSEYILADERVRLLETRRLGLLVRKLRLVAQQNESPQFMVPQLIGFDTDSTKVGMYYSAENEVFSSEMEAHRQQLTLLQRQQPRLEAEMTALTKQLASEQRRTNFIKSRVAELDEYKNKGLVRTYVLNEQQREEARAGSEVARLEADIASLERQMGDLDIRIEEAKAAFKRQVMNGLQETLQNLREIEVTLQTSRDLRDYRAEDAGIRDEDPSKNTIMISRTSQQGANHLQGDLRHDRRTRRRHRSEAQDARSDRPAGHVERGVAASIETNQAEGEDRMAKRVQKSLPGERSVRSLLDPVHIGSPSLGIEYKQVVVETLGKLSRHKLLIMAMVAAALVLGIVAVAGNAQALYRRGLHPRRFGAHRTRSALPSATSGERPVAFDASLLVETRSQLFQSHQLARQVVQSLGLERLRPIVGQGRLSTWLQREFYGDATSAPEYQVDMAATRLMRDLSVKTEPRVYQIVLRYSAKDPELATAVTNAFVVEFLRTTSLAEIVWAARRGASRIDGKPRHARRQASESERGANAAGKRREPS